MIGGVLEPTDIFNRGRAWKNDTLEVGNNFTSVFSVYDIASDRWFTQQKLAASAEPLTHLAQFCTGVASYDNGTHTHHDGKYKFLLVRR